MSLRELAKRLAGGSASIGALVVAVLLPKCPLCIAAALSVLGVGASVGWTVAPIARPLSFAFAGLALLAFARAEWLRRRRRSCASACGRRAVAGTSDRGDVS